MRHVNFTDSWLWSEMRESNPRTLVPKTSAKPTQLISEFKTRFLLCSLRPNLESDSQYKWFAVACLLVAGAGFAPASSGLWDPHKNYSYSSRMEPAVGDDPTTCGLQNRCSANVSYTGNIWLWGPDSNRYAWSGRLTADWVTIPRTSQSWLLFVTVKRHQSSSFQRAIWLVIESTIYIISQSRLLLTNFCLET